MAAAQCETVPTLTLYGTTTIARSGGGGGETSTVVEVRFFPLYTPPTALYQV
jgi:hypothetical protein